MVESPTIVNPPIKIRREVLQSFSSLERDMAEFLALKGRIQIVEEVSDDT